jgi:hypothetical protein
MTTNRPAQESMKRVEAALSEIDGMTAEKVHLHVDGSSMLVRMCLRALCDEGRARYVGRDSGRVYFRVTGKATKSGKTAAT